MENATKALLIAAAILIVILLIAFGMRIFNSTSDTSEQAQAIGKGISEQTGQASLSAIASISGMSNISDDEVKEEDASVDTIYMWRKQNAEKSNVTKSEALEVIDRIDSLNKGTKIYFEIKNLTTGNTVTVGNSYSSARGFVNSNTNDKIKFEITKNSSNVKVTISY